MGSISQENPELRGHKVLILYRRTPSPEFFERVKKSFPGLPVVYKLTQDGKASLPPEEWRDVTVLCTYNSFPAPEQAPKLQYVQLTSAGANHILEDPLYKDTEIDFCSANGVHPPQITEWVICTFLAFEHKIPMFLNAMPHGNWINGQTEDLEDSVGMRMGILGYGSIGRQCARVANALGMDVIAYTFHERSTPESRRDGSYCIPGTGDPDGSLPSRWFHGTTKEDVNNFLAQDLDIVVICLPLTKATYQIISAPQFEIMSKKRTFLSNIGRGAHVHTGDLIQALERGQIRGAALDVTDPEPLPKDHPLWKAPNLILTPHMSGHSRYYTDRVLKILEHNLGRISRGEPVVNKIDRALSY